MSGSPMPTMSSLSVIPLASPARPLVPVERARAKRVPRRRCHRRPPAQERGGRVLRIEMELPDDLVAKLDRIAAATGTSRADLIRDALRVLIASHEEPGSLDQYVGMLADFPEDGLAYQERLR